jgi:thymidine kinase
MKRLVIIFVGISMICHGAEQKPPGSLTVICGPMCSGKTEELIRRINICNIGCLKTLVCKHSFDTRIADKLSCRASIVQQVGAVPLTHADLIYDLAHDYDVVAIDEVQFFRVDLVPAIQRLMLMGKRVMVSGLDMDFKKEPFGECIPFLMCIAHEVIKFKAVCQVCKQYNAIYTQRLINGVPASAQDNLVIVDDYNSKVTYEPRCGNCHQMNMRKSRSLDSLNVIE